MRGLPKEDSVVSGDTQERATNKTTATTDRQVPMEGGRADQTNSWSRSEIFVPSHQPKKQPYVKKTMFPNSPKWDKYVPFGRLLKNHI
jgi:hypothetical protein